ncbi:GGDEF domain-containing protein [Clostridium sp. SM-530-WT-3G]|uniref:diguanylate cyclase n=1 Tax=Clostridium sp. SM-530-WT-3G TaxID=2725303 RepID=UPI00145E58C5|nr:GGDEF domain-containing protein [Clostridium sp. SM-530-WT-3G]
MKNNKKKIYTLLISCILLCTVILGGAYCIRNSIKNILIRSLYNKVEYSKEINSELLISYNAKNIEKINDGKELSAEDYFLIAYEYGYIRKNREEGMKYSVMSQEKQNRFTNKFIELYNEYLMEYYYTYIHKDDSILEKIDNELNSMTIKDWNKYGLLLNAKLGLYINFDDSFDYIMNKAEAILKNESKLDARVIVPIKDTLASIYKGKGYHARVIELSMEIETILNKFNIENGDIYKARARLNEAEIYAKLSDNERAEELLIEVLDMDIKDHVLRHDIKVTALNKLIEIYLVDDKLNEVPDLINKYNYIVDVNKNYNSDIIYYLSLSEYYMEKYEKDKSSKEDLSEAEKYIELCKNCFSGNLGLRYADIDLYESAYEAYLEYLKGNVDYALNKYTEILNNLTDKDLKIYVLQKMQKIYNEEKRYKEVSEYEAKLLQVKYEESLLVNKNYSEYTVAKYENELALRRMNKEKIYNYIKGCIVMLLLTIVIVIVIMKNRELRYKNITDSLTNINNRRYFDEVLNKLLEKNKNFYIFVFDIDNFKKINDTYGHLTGDEVLKRVAQVSKEVIGRNGSIFRYGGEEFVVIVNPRDKNFIINMAEDVRKRIENLIWDNDIKVTISMGVADSAVEKERVLEVADNRLYTSKTTGKNKITFAS